MRAALDLFTTRGFHASTTPAIAHRAGVAEGSIYRHFESKQHLLNELYRSSVAVFARGVSDSEEQQSCRERLEAIASHWMSVAAREPGVVKLVLIAPPQSHLDGPSHDARRRLHEGIESVIASGKSAGEVRPGSVDIWAEVWLRLATLLLDHICRGHWTGDHPGAQHVIRSAWDAIAMINRQVPAPLSSRAYGPDPLSPPPAVSQS